MSRPQSAHGSVPILVLLQRPLLQSMFQWQSWETSLSILVGLMTAVLKLTRGFRFLTYRLAVDEKSFTKKEPTMYQNNMDVVMRHRVGLSRPWRRTWSSSITPLCQPTRCFGWIWHFGECEKRIDTTLLSVGSVQSLSQEMIILA